MGVTFWAERILSISASGKVVSWVDPTNKTDLKDLNEQITHASFQPCAGGLLKFVFATFKGNVVVYNYNHPVAGEAGSINELSFATPGQRPVIVDCGIMSIGETSVVYLATGKGQLRVCAV